MRSTWRPWLWVVLAGCSGDPAASVPPSYPEAEAQGAAVQGDGAPVPIPYAQQPLPGVITGGRPSDADLEVASRHGYKTVVSLLPDADAGDEVLRVERLGMAYVSIPVMGPSDLTEANAMQLGAVLRDPAQRPLILHCGTGNRAGALLALEAFYVEHMPAEEAVALGVKAGLTGLRPAVEQQLGLGPASAE